MQFNLPKLPNPFGDDEKGRDDETKGPDTIGGFVVPPRPERPEFSSFTGRSLFTPFFFGRGLSLRRRARAMGGSKKVQELRALRSEGKLPACLPVCAVFPLSPADVGTGKVVHFVRHGQAEHNLAKDSYVGEGNPYLDPALTDAPLTELGREQARSLLAKTADLPVEVVICSPLHRATETACLGFATHMERGVPFVSNELCREQIGQNMCDARRETALVAIAFPKVDFSAVAPTDELFTPTRETLVELSVRAGAFLQSLQQRPERQIAVVTHSSFLAALFNASVDTRDAPALGEWFGTAEMRSVRLAFPER